MTDASPPETEPLGGLHPTLAYHVVNTLGWTTLRPLQRDALAPVLRGDDALLLAPTAGGKTEAEGYHDGHQSKGTFDPGLAHGTSGRTLAPCAEAPNTLLRPPPLRPGPGPATGLSGDYPDGGPTGGSGAVFPTQHGLHPTSARVTRR